MGEVTTSTSLTAEVPARERLLDGTGPVLGAEDPRGLGERRGRGLPASRCGLMSGSSVVTVTVVPGVDRSPLRGPTAAFGCHRHNPASRRRRTAPPLSITVGGTPYWGCGCTLGCTPLRERQPVTETEGEGLRAGLSTCLKPSSGAGCSRSWDLMLAGVPGGCRVVAGVQPLPGDAGVLAGA
jgi:hypothetical protein